MAALSLSLLVVAVTVGSFGLTITLLLSLLVAVPMLRDGRGRAAAISVLVGGAVPLLLGMAMYGCYQLDKASSGDPMYGAKNHEVGFAAALFMFGVGLPSMVAGVVAALFAAGVARRAETRALDAGDAAVCGAGVSASLVGVATIALLRTFSMAPPPTQLVLVGVGLALASLSAWREAARVKAIGALFDGGLPGLSVEQRPQGAPSSLPPLVSTSAPLDAVLVAHEGPGAAPYRDDDERLLSALPSSRQKSVAPPRRRLLLSLLCCLVDGALLLWLLAYLKR